VYNKREGRGFRAGCPEGPTLEAAAEKLPLKVVFMGSDAFSVPSLEACLARAEIVAVYTRPDRRSGRGRKRVVSPVQAAAANGGLQLEQPERFDKACVEGLRGFGADLVVVAAYGMLLPAAALRAARLDSINVHASLLPRHRGAAPVAAAILAGDAETGVTVMKLRPELDAGETVTFGRERRRAQRATPIGESETAGELLARLARIGAELLAEVLPAYAEGSVTYEAQDASRATYAPALRKADGRIDWSRRAGEVVRHVRAMTPWPGAFTSLRVPGCEPVRLTLATAREGPQKGRGDPGRLAVEGSRRLVAGTAAGSVEVLRLKPAGRKEMDAAEFLRGAAALREALARGEACSFGDT